MYDILELSKKLVPELRDIARELKINKADTLKKQDLIYKILDQQAIAGEPAAEKNASPAQPSTMEAEPERKLRPRRRENVIRPVNSQPLRS